mmetsp:Transcript_85674/g.250842  ORF Transcript_85674/g.250842 Transcript_85674/m.250842 type:complete len:263 (+) Transcript_85674:233-1021(+)
MSPRTASAPSLLRRMGHLPCCIAPSSSLICALTEYGGTTSRAYASCCAGRSRCRRNPRPKASRGASLPQFWPTPRLRSVPERCWDSCLMTTLPWTQVQQRTQTACTTSPRRSCRSRPWTWTPRRPARTASTPSDPWRLGTSSSAGERPCRPSRAPTATTASAAKRTGRRGRTRAAALGRPSAAGSAPEAGPGPSGSARAPLGTATAAPRARRARRLLAETRGGASGGDRGRGLAAAPRRAARPRCAHRREGKTRSSGGGCNR